MYLRLIHSVILAAGRGTRMRSAKPKVLHSLAGKPLLHHVLDTVLEMKAERISVVVGFESQQVADSVKSAYAGREIFLPCQLDQLGTGHAVLQALPSISLNEQVLVLYGDVPLISDASLRRFIQQSDGKSLGVLTVKLADPTGYGRIVRREGKIVAIVEQKDADNDDLAISEVNTGIMLIPPYLLREALPRLSNDNAQKEYYLTDLVKHAAESNINIFSHTVEDFQEVSGVNDRVQLSDLEFFYQQNIRKDMQVRGVTFANPGTFLLRGDLVSLGSDIDIDQNVIFEGNITLGSNIKIGSNCVIRNSSIGDGSQIKDNSIIDNAQIGSSSFVGPFARIRPGTVLGDGVHIGNFVEIKNSFVDTDSKVSHLSYVGDARIGKRVNIGAGTITCNYDGVNKHATIIKDDAFIGSNSSLVAPVIIYESATIGAGSVICKDALASTLTVARAKQVTIEGWKRPEKASKTQKLP